MLRSAQFKLRIDLGAVVSSHTCLIQEDSRAVFAITCHSNGDDHGVRGSCVGIMRWVNVEIKLGLGQCE